MQTINQTQIINLLKNTYCFADQWGTYFCESITEKSFTLGEESFLFEGASVTNDSVTFLCDSTGEQHTFMVLVDITPISMCEAL